MNTAGSHITITGSSLYDVIRHDGSSTILPELVVESRLASDGHAVDVFLRKDVDVDELCHNPASHPDQRAIDVDGLQHREESGDTRAGLASLVGGALSQDWSNHIFQDDEAALTQEQTK